MKNPNGDGGGFAHVSPQSLVIGNPPKAKFPPYKSFPNASRCLLRGKGPTS